MNVTQVDIVGHSQGGILARYWIKYLDGAGKVYRHVGISAINHGTTLSGITLFAKALGIFTPSQPLFDAVAPSLFQMGRWTRDYVLSEIFNTRVFMTSMDTNWSHLLTIHHPQLIHPRSWPS